MSAAPRVSVVVIVRDGERFLAEALESICAQTYPLWEAIVVDDGSRDGSAAIAARFAEREPRRIRLLRHEGGANLGMSASRNLGIRAAHGEFVTFLDHDDCMEPSKLAAQVDALDGCSEAVAVIGPNLRWQSWRGGAGADDVQDLGVPADRLLAAPGLLPVFLVRTSATPQAPMVRRSVIDTIGGFEPEFRGMYEDQVFLAKLSAVGAVWISSGVWQRYRQHDESCVRVAHRGGRHIAARARFLRWLAQWLAGAPLRDEERARLQSIVRRERRKLWWARLRLWMRLRR